MADIFISHSSIDKELADALCEMFENKGLKCWIAPRDIRPGSDWAVAINDAISNVKAMVVIYSRNAAQSTQVPKEIALAESRGKFVLPYKVDETPLEGAFAYYLTGAHWIMANPQKNDYKFDELFDVISEVVQSPAEKTTNILYDGNFAIHQHTPATDVQPKKQKPPVSSTNLFFKIAGITIAVLLVIAVFLGVLIAKSENVEDEDKSKRKEYENQVAGEDDEADSEEVDPETEQIMDGNFIYKHGNSGIIITEYVGTEQHVAVPVMIDGIPVTEIGAWAFAQTEVVSVTIPEGVTSIGYSAFFECSQLTEISLPDSLLVIEEWAFAKTALGEVMIPDGIEQIREFAFQDSVNVVVYLWGDAYPYEDVAGMIVAIEE